MNKEVRNLYQGIKREREDYQLSPTFFKTSKGELIGEENEILELQMEHFSTFLNEGEEDENENIEERKFDGAGNHAGEEEAEPSSVLKIREIIKRLKKKSPGDDNITAELYKYGGGKMILYLQKLLEEVWREEKISQSWNEAILLPIYKKSNKAECVNYRGIALLNVAYKILAPHIKGRLIQYIEDDIGEYQCGFRKGRSVMDQIFALKGIQAENYQHSEATYVLFIDYKQVCRIKRKELYKALKELGVNSKLVSMVKLTLKETDNRVRVKGKLTEKFKVQEGLR